MKIACIDTQILSWSIVKHPPKGNEDLVATASDFVKWIDEQKYSVIVPTIVVSELLVPVPLSDHQDVLAQLAKDYRIVPFDIVSARYFAEIQQNHITKHRLKELRNPNILNATKTALKADVMIIATAMRYEATIIFSQDAKMKNMAEGFIDVRSFDDTQFQRSFFSEMESDNEDDEYT